MRRRQAALWWLAVMASMGCHPGSQPTALASATSTPPPRAASSAQTIPAASAGPALAAAPASPSPPASASASTTYALVVSFGSECCWYAESAHSGPGGGDNCVVPSPPLGHEAHHARVVCGPVGRGVDHLVADDVPAIPEHARELAASVALVGRLPLAAVEELEDQQPSVLDAPLGALDPAGVPGDVQERDQVPPLRAA